MTAFDFELTNGHIARIRVGSFLLSKCKAEAGAGGRASCKVWP